MGPIPYVILVTALAPARAPLLDLARIYETHVAYVWESLRRLGVPEADLEDVTHEVFMAVHRHLAEYDHTRPIRPWLFGFALRLASDYRRSGRRRREVVMAVPAAPSPGPSPLDRAVASEARELVLAALGPLSLDARAVLVLHDLDGHSMPEIAALLGEPLNTLYSRLRLARARFTVELRAAMEGGTP